MKQSAKEIEKNERDTKKPSKKDPSNPPTNSKKNQLAEVIRKLTTKYNSLKVSIERELSEHIETTKIELDQLDRRIRILSSDLAETSTKSAPEETGESFGILNVPAYPSELEIVGFQKRLTSSSRPLDEIEQAFKNTEIHKKLKKEFIDNISSADKISHLIIEALQDLSKISTTFNDSLFRSWLIEYGFGEFWVNYKRSWGRSSDLSGNSRISGRINKIEAMIKKLRLEDSIKPISSNKREYVTENQILIIRGLFRLKEASRSELVNFAFENKVILGLPSKISRDEITLMIKKGLSRLVRKFVIVKERSSWCLMGESPKPALEQHP